jgi:hypothetical protein
MRNIGHRKAETYIQKPPGRDEPHLEADWNGGKESRV